jgi:hypothetical protein
MLNVRALGNSSTKIQKNLEKVTKANQLHGGWKYTPLKISLTFVLSYRIVKLLAIEVFIWDPHTM